MALGGGGGGQTQTQGPTSVTQTNITEPWAPQQPYLTAGFSAAQNLLNNPQQIFPNSMTVPLSPESQTAMQMITQQALNGSPVNNSASNQLQSTLNGDYLNNPTTAGNNLYGNPGFNAAVKAATDYAMPQINSEFERSGRLNSGLNQVADTQAIADAFASQYGQQTALQEQNYEAGRQNQLQAAALAPTAASQGYIDAGALNSVGETYQNQLQNQLNQQIYGWNYPTTTAQNNLDNYMQLISGNFGQSSTGTTTSSGGTNTLSYGTGNPLSGALGGALAGSSLFGTGGALASLGLSSTTGALLGGGLGLLSSFI